MSFVVDMEKQTTVLEILHKFQEDGKCVHQPVVFNSVLYMRKYSCLYLQEGRYHKTRDTDRLQEK